MYSVIFCVFRSSVLTDKRFLTRRSKPFWAANDLKSNETPPGNLFVHLETFSLHHSPFGYWWVTCATYHRLLFLEIIKITTTKIMSHIWYGLQVVFFTGYRPLKKVEVQWKKPWVHFFQNVDIWSSVGIEIPFYWGTTYNLSPVITSLVTLQT